SPRGPSRWRRASPGGSPPTQGPSRQLRQASVLHREPGAELGQRCATAASSLPSGASGSGVGA
ncbi:MAG: hypothetical protein WKF57_22565, partial [Nakamurella sp.]